MMVEAEECFMSSKLCVCVSGGSFLLMHTQCSMFELVCLLTITDLIYKTDHF